MSSFYRHLVRPFLFAQDSEAIHDRTVDWLARASRQSVLCELLSSFFRAPLLPVQLFGLSFPNPIGLAAGMDKKAVALPVWAALGFGFSEIGGVTWHPQPGNPAPRMFRVVDDGALINRMGFNNAGAQAMAATLDGWKNAGRWPAHPVGINLGKSKITPLTDAAAEYARCFELLRAYADFFVINVSSPNTPNLRDLQDRDALDEILVAVQELNHRQALPPRPILVKVAPDLSWSALDEIIELALSRQLAGVVATNTTITRPETSDPCGKRVYQETGGLSGRPLRRRSTEIIRHIYRHAQGRLPIIGVGGIFDADDAWEKIVAGASLLQLYTGLVYEGPSVTRQIVRGLRQRLVEAGLEDCAQAVGLEHRPGQSDQTRVR